MSVYKIFGRKFFFKNQNIKIENRHAYKILNSFTMRPEVLESYKAKIRENNEFKYALFRDKTKIFDNVLNFATSQVQNIFIIIPGLPGTGKSTTAKSLAIEIRNRRKKYRNINGKIHIAYKKDQLQDIFQKVNQGAVILKDENPIVHGTGSQISMDAISNFMGVVRDREISAVLVSPREYQKNEFYLGNIFLLPIGYDIKTKLNRCIWIDKAGHYIGIVFIPFKNDVKIEKKMNIMKNKLQEELKKYRGNIFTQHNLKMIEKDVQTVLDYYENHPLPPRISKTSLKNDFWDVGIRGDNKYQDIIASRVHKILHYKKNQNIKIEKKIELQKYKIEYNNNEYIEYTLKIIDAHYNEQFRELVLQKLKSEFNISPLEIKIFDRIATGETYTKIKNDLELSTISKCNQVKNKIQKIFLGKAGELAFKDCLINQGKNFEYFGSNTPKPDFIVHSSKEVISFKCYTHHHDAYAKKTIGRQEFEYAMRHNYKLMLYIFILQENEFNIYQVFIKKN